MRDQLFPISEELIISGISASVNHSACTIFIAYRIDIRFQTGNLKRHWGVKEYNLSENCVPTLIDEAYGKNSKRILGICFVNATKTLVICSEEVVNNNRGIWMVALSRRGLKYRIEDQSFFNTRLGKVHIAELSEGRILCGQLTTASLYLQVMQLQLNHHIRTVSPIKTAEKIFGFDAIVVNDNTLVALISCDKPQVRIYKLIAYKSLQYVYHMHHPSISRILWYENHLLAGCWNSKTHSVVEVKFFEGAHVSCDPSTVLLNYNIHHWCTSGKYIVIIDYNKSLHLYSTTIMQ